jgi:hypothetical protein
MGALGKEDTIAALDDALKVSEGRFLCHRGY